jgi:drug/metabolite transporter (DMT)-like permease
LIAVVAVTAVWGVTFVQVKDALAVYPLFAFLAARYLLASGALAAAGARRLALLRGGGVRAGVFLGALLALGNALQTAGLERTTVSSTGFITGLYVVFTPPLGVVLFRTHVGLPVWGGVALSVSGIALLSGVAAGSAAGDLLVLASAAAQALQIVMVERFASRYDAIALTLVEMATCFVAFAVSASALGELELPHGAKVWSALVVTGLFASALAYLVQVWAQRQLSAPRIAIVFSLETVWAGFFGYVLSGDRLGWAGWSGCAAIFGAILLAEPAAARALAGFVARLRTA